MAEKKETSGKKNEDMKYNNFSNKKYFYNRELSWLDFNYRVLSEAKNKSNPLFERLKFLAITASNLDEFFMIRVASLKDMVNVGYKKKDMSGLDPMAQLARISVKTHELVREQYFAYNRSFVPSLKNNGIILVNEYEKLNKKQSAYVDDFFQNEVYPVLTPMAVDSSRPFPLVRNKTLNICALLCDKKEEKELDFATVQVPDVLPRLVKIPSEKDKYDTYIFLEQIIEKNINKLFLNYEIIGSFPYRIMRNADLSIDEDEAADLLIEIEKKLKKRQWGEVIRLEVEHKMDKRLVKILKNALNISSDDIYEVSGPLDLTFLYKVYGIEGYENLKQEEFIPQQLPDFDMYDDIFEQIRKKDILLHHPYNSFEPVVEFIKQAAKDKNVLAIKQTLYRVSSNSPIIAYLAQAAENGKQVTVLVELKARFDEQNNIIWAKKLEKAGCHVIYGLLGLKTHSKITLVVRREEAGIKRYVHLGTGNYNDSTAKLYTDMGLFTSASLIGEDATAVFNMISGYSEPLTWNKLTIAPFWLRDKFLELINNEIKNAKEGKKAFIIAKMNSLCDTKIIKALYEASSVGVKIDLIVRGICTLKIGIKGVSENITVRSIVGRFLEHARIFYFCNDQSPLIYLGSADWMPRNLDKRVEILFPIEDNSLKKKVIKILNNELKDNVKSHILTADGEYVRMNNESLDKFCAQEYFMRKAKKDAQNMNIKTNNTRVFEPLTSIDYEDNNDK